MKKDLIGAVVGMVLVLGGAVCVYGQQAGGGGQGGQRMGPPLEAYAACEGKTTGSKSQFTNPAGEVVTGICQVADGKLVLRPDNPKGGKGREGQQGPPPEAYTACTGKAAGAVAQFTDPRGEVLKGTCEEENGRMVLRPDRNRERSGLMSGNAESRRDR